MLALPFLVKSLLRFSEVLFAPSCLVCQSSSSQLLCHRCQLPNPVNCYPTLRCQQCYERILTGDICNLCEIQAQFFEHSRYLWDYTANARDFCVALKYKPSLKLIDYAASCLAIQLPEIFLDKDWDYLLPIPASKSGFKKRGFNHVELLAQKLKAKAGLNSKVLATALKSSRNRRAQASLSDQARLTGISTRYKLSEKSNKLVYGKSVLLLDDVTTTGATVKAAAQLLIRAGVDRVDILTLCRSPTWYRFRAAC